MEARCSRPLLAARCVSTYHQPTTALPNARDNPGAWNKGNPTAFTATRTPEIEAAILRNEATYAAGVPKMKFEV